MKVKVFPQGVIDGKPRPNPSSVGQEVILSFPARDERGVEIANFQVGGDTVEQLNTFAVGANASGSFTANLDKMRFTVTMPLGEHVEILPADVKVLTFKNASWKRSVRSQQATEAAMDPEEAPDSETMK